MSKIARFALILLLTPILSYAQTFVQSTLLGYGQDETANIFQIDDGGNAYVVMNGRYAANVGGQMTTPHGAILDFSVIEKLNAQGKVTWSRTITADNGSDYIADLKLDPDGNIYISGIGTHIKLDDGTILPDGAFLLKLNNNSKILWGISNENAYYVDRLKGGPISITEDGVFWASSFFETLKIIQPIITTTNNAELLPDTFVARVKADGTVANVYHPPYANTYIQTMVPAENGGASGLVGNGGSWRRLLFDKDAKVFEESFFAGISNSLSPIRGKKPVYEKVDNYYLNLKTQGFYYFKLDDKLNILDQFPVFPTPVAPASIAQVINFNNNGFFYITVPKPELYFTDGKGSKAQISNDNQVIPKSNVPPFTFTLLKMTGDTLNMLVRHYNFYEKDYVFNGENISKPSNLQASYHWVKYYVEDPGKCKRVTAEVIQNGTEGSKDAVIKLSIPEGCPAEEDIIINATPGSTGSSNNGDFILQPQAIIKKGETSATLTMKVNDDQYIENLETFTVNLDVVENDPGYRIVGTQFVNFNITDNDNTTANKTYTITYPAQVKEGTSGMITVALPTNVLLSNPLMFMLMKDKSAYPALEGADYTKLTIIIPAGKNSVQVPLEALTDGLLEGDELVSGHLVPVSNSFGPFLSPNNVLNIKISDAENVSDNRVIEITPNTDVLNEGGAVTYTFKLPPQVTLQNSLKIGVNPAVTYDFLTQSATDIPFNAQTNSGTITITYPDDLVIRTDKVLSLLLSAVDPNAGAFRFKWKDAFTTSVELNAIDNDGTYARLTLSPLKLTIAEGNTDYITLKLAGGRSMEDDISINYTLTGQHIDQENRLGSKTVQTTFPKGQNELRIPVKVIFNWKYDTYNQRTINFDQPFTATRTVPLDPQQTVELTIIDLDISVPNAFTPNGDGVNDTWKIPNLNSDNQSKVNIYSRSGGLVYRSTGYAIPWDGKVNGAAAPVGVYYYTITAHDRTFSGSVMVVR